MSWNTVRKAWKGCVCVCMLLFHLSTFCRRRATAPPGMKKKKCERVLSEPCFTAFDTMNSQLYYWSLARNSTSFCMEPQKASSVYFVIHCLRVRFCRAFGITRLLITQSCNTYNPLETQSTIKYIKKTSLWHSQVYLMKWPEIFRKITRKTWTNLKFESNKHRYPKCGQSSYTTKFLQLIVRNMNMIWFYIQFWNIFFIHEILHLRKQQFNYVSSQISLQKTVNVYCMLPLSEWICPYTRHEGIRGEWRYSSTLS